MLIMYLCIVCMYVMYVKKSMEKNDEEKALSCDFGLNRMKFSVRFS